MIDRAAVKRHFSRASHSYDAAAVMQREVAERLAERLPLFNLIPQTICDLGAGTGFLSQHLLGAYPKANVYAVDLSRDMLERSRDKDIAAVTWWQRLNPFKAAPNVHYVNADAYQLPFADGSMDMITSSLMLQWCDDLDAVLAECRRVLKVNGILMMASLGPDTLKELRRAWQSVDGQAEQHLLNFVDMHDLGDALGRAGFGNPVCDAEHITLTYQYAKLALQDLKSIGATNANRSRQAGLMGRHKWQSLLDAYQAQALPNGLVPTTFEIVYVHGWAVKPVTSSASNGVSIIPIEKIQRWQSSSGFNKSY